MPLASQHAVPRRAAFGAQHEHAARWNDPPAAAGACTHVCACTRATTSTQHATTLPNFAWPRGVMHMRTHARARMHAGATRKADAKSRFPPAARPAGRDAAGRQVWEGEAGARGEGRGEKKQETGDEGKEERVKVHGGVEGGFV